MMEALDFFEIIQNDVHSTVIATVDDDGFPVTCVIDIMDYDSDGLYFLTAKGKNFYNRLIDRKYLSLTGMKGSDTMHCISVSLRGKVREIGNKRLGQLIDKNPYMNEIYPTVQSKQALTVFQIYEGTGEYFDLSKKPIERYSFSFGGENKIQHGYYINGKCTGCGKCRKVCPQNCIDISDGKAEIRQSNCLHCGNCINACPFRAVEKR